MTPEAKQLLKDKPELCKEIAEDYRVFWNTVSEGGDASFEAFAKEHTAKDWEILSFKQAYAGQIAKLANGRYAYEFSMGEFTLEEGIKAVGFKQLYIHSVRRSDGEVFEVDTETDHGRITGFRIENHVMMAAFEGWTRCTELNNLIKLKPLFKTEDGVDIFKGDRTVPVNKLSFKIWNAAETYISPSTSGNWIYFSTREAAEAWVSKNKPKFSEQQLIDAGIDIYSNDTLYPF